MSRILIVESNSPDMVAGGRTCARPFLDTLPQLDPTLTLTLSHPYETPFSESELEGIEAVIFTGSGVEWSTADERAAPLADAMEKVFDHGLPTWGSCNGMQLAACVLGGSVGASPKGREEGVARDLTLTSEGEKHAMMTGRETGWSVLCVHRDEVQSLPRGADLLAGNAHSPVQAFAYERDGVDFWGVQYHPEYIAGDVAEGMARRNPQDPRLADLGAAHADPDAAARLGTTPDALTLPFRATELVNWLAHIRAR